MRRHLLQDATGVLLHKPPQGPLFIVQTADPTNGVVGYAKGCFWINENGAASHVMFGNQGDHLSATWVNIF